MTRLQTRYATALALILTAACGGQTQEPADSGATVRVAQVDHPAIHEASGLAASRVNHGLLWTHNDSGGSPALFGVNAGGEYLGRLDVLGAFNTDWEDIAAYHDNGKDWLVIADVGDNLGLRGGGTLYFVEEPRIPAGDKPFELTAEAARALDFRFADGSRDIEGVAVDAAAGEVLLVSKRERPPVLYRLPLHPDSEDARPVAEPLTAITQIPEPTANDRAEDPENGRYRAQPTALDLSADGRRLLVTTYKNAYVYTRGEDESWSQTLSAAPRRIDPPQFKQTESGAFSPDGRRAYFMSEGRPAGLAVMRLD